MTQNRVLQFRPHHCEECSQRRRLQSKLDAAAKFAKTIEDDLPGISASFHIPTVEMMLADSEEQYVTLHIMLESARMDLDSDPMRYTIDSLRAMAAELTKAADELESEASV